MSADNDLKRQKAVNNLLAGSDPRAKSHKKDPNANIAERFDMIPGEHEGSFTFVPKTPEAPAPAAPLYDAASIPQELRTSNGGRNKSFVFGSTFEEQAAETNAAYNGGASADEVQGGIIIDGRAYSTEEIAALRGAATDTFARSMRPDNRPWYERQAEARANANQPAAQPAAQPATPGASTPKPPGMSFPTAAAPKPPGAWKRG